MTDSKVDRTTFRKRIFAHRAKILSAVITILAALVVTGIVLYNSYVMKQYISYSVVSEVERRDVSGAKVLGYGNMFVTYSVDGIHCTDAKGSDVWSFPFEMQTPMVEVNGDYVACADYNGRNIYVFNKQGTAGSIQTNVPIKKICVSETGVVAAVVDEGNVTPILLYYYDGTQLASFRTTMSKSGYPLAISISDNSKLVAVSYLYVDSGTLTTKIAFYNFGEVGKNESDNLVSGYDFQEEIIPLVEFLNEDTAFALANDRLVFFEGKERPVNKANIMLQNEIHAVFYGDNRVGLVYLDATGESKYRMDVYNSSGKLVNTINFDLEYSDIFFANNRTVIYNAASALIYDDSGHLKFDGVFEESVSLIVPTVSDTKYVLVTPEKIETIVLQ